jgi:hypothetical protein
VPYTLNDRKHSHDLSDASSSVCDEDLILHKAVAILRKHIGDLVIESSEYTSSTDTSLSHSLNVMPPVLKTFLCWLLADVVYDTVFHFVNLVIS